VEIAGLPADLEPVDYLLQVMRDPTADLHMRFAAAKAAAPYRHAKLQSVQLQQLGADGQPIGPKIVEVECIIEHRTETRVLAESSSVIPSESCQRQLHTRSKTVVIATPIRSGPSPPGPKR
jgi:hypothetical protein